MKIVQVIPYFCFGGGETMCENLTYALMRMGHQVTAVSLYAQRTPISLRMEQAGVKLVYLDKKLGLDVTMIPKLWSVFRSEQPDVVHTHLDVIKYAVPAAKLAGIRRCVHTVHNVADKEAEGRLQKLTNTFFYRRSWSVPVALSPQVQQTILPFYGLKAEQVPVIYNGVDLSRFSPKTDYALGAPVELLHVGRLNPQKNHGRLLRAFSLLHAEYPQCHLTLVGDGELRQEVESLVKDLGLEQAVTFAGAQADVRPYLEKADIFVLPSDYEGIPMTIIEAMATGLPIVATAVGGVPDMLRQEESGLLVPPEEMAVAQACARLVQSRTLRERLGRNARADTQRFSAEHMAQSYAGVYEG